jgi:hypothetical protein
MTFSIKRMWHQFENIMKQQYFFKLLWLYIKIGAQSSQFPDKNKWSEFGNRMRV